MRFSSSANPRPFKVLNLRFLLTPFIPFYFVGLSFDRWWRSRKATKLTKPVISIGNLTVGGTGKTPLLIRLAKDLVQQGVRPAILTRGYGEDEIFLMREKCPGVPLGVGSHRIEKAHEVLASNQVDVFLLDDGFQHWPLQRQLDIVCVDAAAPFEEELLLPAGRLREPWRGFSRANMVVITRTNLVSVERLGKMKSQIQALTPAALIVSVHFDRQLKQTGVTDLIPWNSLRGKRVLALSAIGNPESFEKDLASEGASVFPMRFRDHHNYQASDISKIQALAKKNQSAIVTTEKDWVKLKKWSLPAYVVEQKPLFSEQDEKLWLEKIHQVIS